MKKEMKIKPVLPDSTTVWGFPCISHEDGRDKRYSCLPTFSA